MSPGCVGASASPPAWVTPHITYSQSTRSLGSAQPAEVSPSVPQTYLQLLGKHQIMTPQRSQMMTPQGSRAKISVVAKQHQIKMGAGYVIPFGIRRSGTSVRHHST